MNFNEEENSSYGKFQNQKAHKQNEIFQSKTHREESLNDEEDYVFDPNIDVNEDDEAY